jgi:hypothetical protein
VLSRVFASDRTPRAFIHCLISPHLTKHEHTKARRKPRELSRSRTTRSLGVVPRSASCRSTAGSSRNPVPAESIADSAFVAKLDTSGAFAYSTYFSRVQRDGDPGRRRRQCIRVDVPGDRLPLVTPTRTGPAATGSIATLSLRVLLLAPSPSSRISTTRVEPNSLTSGCCAGIRVSLLYGFRSGVI